MPRKKPTSRQQELLRRLRQGKTPTDEQRRSRESVLAELTDPARLAHHVRAFSGLAMLLEPLHACRYPADDFVDAVLDSAPTVDATPDDERLRTLRAAIVPRFAGRELLDRCHAAVRAALEQATEPETLMGLTAGGALLSSCRQEGARADHPFWAVLFDVSLTEALLSGHLLVRLVLRSIEVDVDGVTRAFTRALARSEVSRELDELGLREPDARRLAQGLRDAVDTPYHLYIDAVLRLCRTHIQLAETVGQMVAVTGLTEELRTRMLAAHAEALRADLDPQAIEDLVRWLRARLARLRDEPDAMRAQLPPAPRAGGDGEAADPIEAERWRALGALLALRALPPDENPLLRAVHARSLELARTQSAPGEGGFVSRLWSDPEDVFALEEFERFLLDKGEPRRSRRVHKFLAEVREARRERRGDEPQVPAQGSDDSGPADASGEAGASGAERGPGGAR